MTFCCVGDFNAVLGSSNEGFEACMGKMGAGKEMSDNGVASEGWAELGIGAKDALVWYVVVVCRVCGM